MPLSVNFEKNWLNLQSEYKSIDFWEANPNQVLADFLEKFKRFPIIAITWPAWTWKTTVTNAVAKFYNAKIFRELPELNPFLALIWKTKDKVKDSLWFPNQTLFCTQDAAIITDWFINASKTPIVFDFAITQTKAYWDLKLKWKEKENFTRLFENIVHWDKNWWFWWLPVPDLVIEVKSDDKSIISRRQARGKRVDSVYEDEVWEMNRLYDSWFVQNHYEKVIVFDNNAHMSEQDLIKKINNFLQNL